MSVRVSDFAMQFKTMVAHTNAEQISSLYFLRIWLISRDIVRFLHLFADCPKQSTKFSSGLWTLTDRVREGKGKKQCTKTKRDVFENSVDAKNDVTSTVASQSINFRETFQPHRFLRWKTCQPLCERRRVAVAHVLSWYTVFLLI